MRFKEYVKTRYESDRLKKTLKESIRKTEVSEKTDSSISTNVSDLIQALQDINNPDIELKNTPQGLLIKGVRLSL
jgi:transcriptional regulator NrdR family protein